MKKPRFKKVKTEPPKTKGSKILKVGKKVIKPVSFVAGVRQRRGAVISGQGGVHSHQGGYGIVKLPNYLAWSNKNKQVSVSKNRIGIPTLEWKKIQRHFNSKRVVVLLHIYYNDPQITQEILKGLQTLPFTIDLCVSLIKGKGGNVETKKLIENVFANVKFFEVRNRGKDIGGKLTMFKYLLLEKSNLGYDYMLLIHDKKSPHSTISGDGWRRALLRGVLHTESVKTGFTIMETDNDIIGFGSSHWLRGGPISLVTMIGPRAAKGFIDKMLTKLGRKVPNSLWVCWRYNVLV